MEALIMRFPDDPRLSEWLVTLGCYYTEYESDYWMKIAKDTFLQSGELGCGEAYSRIAHLCAETQDWDEARMYFRKAARLHQTVVYCSYFARGETGYLARYNALCYIQSTTRWGGVSRSTSRC